ncbi:hypothetical protein ACE939_13010 [Aquimarina sp. W85]|uniref:hypothetical protein n=1 Tax=Aquimarina rhodophyticola TaxID=3342246 RepID=UPI00366DC8C5
MKNLERLKQFNYRTLDRKETGVIRGGFESCVTIRANCYSRCGGENACYFNCLTDANCPFIGRINYVL